VRESAVGSVAAFMLSEVSAVERTESDVSIAPSLRAAMLRTPDAAAPKRVCTAIAKMATEMMYFALNCFNNPKF
jgi:hypothetical protein